MSWVPNWGAEISSHIDIGPKIFQSTIWTPATESFGQLIRHVGCQQPRKPRNPEAVWRHVSSRDSFQYCCLLQHCIYLNSCNAGAATVPREYWLVWYSGTDQPQSCQLVYGHIFIGKYIYIYKQCLVGRFVGGRILVGRKQKSPWSVGQAIFVCAQQNSPNRKSPNKIFIYIYHIYIYIYTYFPINICSYNRGLW